MDNNRLFLAENTNKNLDENLVYGLNRDDEDIEIFDRGDGKDKKQNKPKKPKKLKFKDYKKNTIKSLNEVEYFLNNLDKAFKCVHIFKILR